MNPIGGSQGDGSLTVPNGMAMSPQFSVEVPSASQNDSSNAPKVRTFRARGVPIGLNWDAAEALLKASLERQDLQLCSLAYDPYRMMEQVATFQASQFPHMSQKQPGQKQPGKEWHFTIPGTTTHNKGRRKELTITID